MDADKLKDILDLHGKWARGDVGGKRADLQGADLRGAYLRGSYLRGADLQGADLRDAYLRGADLRDADLQGADLRGAYLRGADLRDAYLQGADLQGADLQGAYLQDDSNITGEPWSEYLGKVLPALLTAGGKALDDVACPEHWECHSWDNCPMAAAFDCKDPSDTPLLLRPRVEQFVQLFDAKLIPLELVNPKYAAARTPNREKEDG